MTALSFAIVPVPVLSDSALTRLDQIIFAALKSHARPDKPLVWPSRTRLARLVGCSLASVSRSLKRLVAAGWILVRRTGRANRVTVFDVPKSHQMCSQSHIDTSICEETIEIPPLPPVGEMVAEAIASPSDPVAPVVDQEGITPDQAAILIAYFNATTGARLDAAPKPIARLVNRRLRHYTPAQLQCAISFYFSLWRGTSMELHARNLRTVLAPTRIAHALSEIARNQEQAKARTTVIWKPEKIKQAEPGTVRSSIADMLKILR